MRVGGFTWRHIDDQSDLNVAMMAAYVAAHRGAPADVLPMVARVAEKLVAEEANYDLVLALVENLQHLASHGLEQLHTAEDFAAVLGPRCLVVWQAVEEFWTTVAERSNVDILSVENEQLRASLWTSNGSLGDDTRVGTAEAVLHEKAIGTSIPGYRELFA